MLRYRFNGEVEPMSWGSKFHLVDASGNPLGERFQQVARKLERQFFAAQPKVGDDAVVCNCVERTALKVHTHEEKYGLIEDLAPYFLRTYSNVVNTLLRGGYHTIHEDSVPDQQLELRAGPSRTDSAETIERKILINQALRNMDKDKRAMLALDVSGYSAKQIAKRFGTTEGNIYTILHRAREEARKVLQTHGSSRSG